MMYCEHHDNYDVFHEELINALHRLRNDINISLRIDTHEGNAIMRHLIDKAGFSYCGKAILTPDKDRMVFEKVLSE